MLNDEDKPGSVLSSDSSEPSHCFSLAEWAISYHIRPVKLSILQKCLCFSPSQLSHPRPCYACEDKGKKKNKNKTSASTR